MKKRLNILCVLAFAVVIMGVVPVVYAMSVGFRAGFTLADDGRDSLHTQEVLRMAGGSQVILMPKGDMKGLTHGTIRNEVDGQTVDLWPDRISVDVAVERPAWFRPLSLAITPLTAIAFVVVMCLFLRLIVRVNRGTVFEWRNVRLLRWIGGLMLLASVASTAVQCYDAWLVSQRFAVGGYGTDYFSNFSALELTVGLVALIVAEIFAVGLKMKEEQDLTI